MHKIGDDTTTADPVTGEWTEGGPGGTPPATIGRAAWLNTIQREMLNVLAAASVAPSVGADDQMLAALKLIFPQVVNTVAILRGIAPQPNRMINLMSHTNAGDGGDGLFYGVTGAAPGTYVDNNGMTVVPTGGNGSAAWLRDCTPGKIDVRWMGAQNGLDCSAQVLSAYNALPATGGAIYFSGEGLTLGTPISLTSRQYPFCLSLIGDGDALAGLNVTTATGNAISIATTGSATIKDLGVLATVARTIGTYLISVENTGYLNISSLFFSLSQGRGLYVNSITELRIDNCHGGSLSASAGETCLKIHSIASGVISNCYFRTGPANVSYGLSPCCWIGGGLQITALKISNCGFLGGGPAYSVTNTGITSTAGNFTVTTSSAHPFVVGDFVVLRGCAPTTYLSVYKIASVTSNTYTVNSSINPGPSTVHGKSEYIAASIYIENGGGPANESQLNNVIAEGFGFRGSYGSAGLFVDGKRSVNAMEGWEVTGGYSDFGSMGVVLSGKDTGTDDPTVSGWTFSGMGFDCETRNFLIDQVPGVTISGLMGNGLNSASTGDAIGPSAAVQVLAGTTGAIVRSRGITINGSTLGVPRTWGNWAARSYDYAVYLDGAGIEDVVVTGNNLYGRVGAVGQANSALADTSRWKFSGNNVSANVPPTSSLLIPSVASATSVTLPLAYDAVKMTGMTNIQNIFGGHVGREVTLLFTNSLTLVSGGNLAITATYGVSQGQQVSMIFDGASWYVK